MNNCASIGEGNKIQAGEKKYILKKLTSEKKFRVPQKFRKPETSGVFSPKQKKTRFFSVGKFFDTFFEKFETLSRLVSLILKTTSNF